MMVAVDGSDSKVAKSKEEGARSKEGGREGRVRKEGGKEGFGRMTGRSEVRSRSSWSCWLVLWLFVGSW